MFWGVIRHLTKTQLKLHFKPIWIIASVPGHDGRAISLKFYFPFTYPPKNFFCKYKPPVVATLKIHNGPHLKFGSDVESKMDKLQS